MFFRAGVAAGAERRTSGSGVNQRWPGLLAGTDHKDGPAAAGSGCHSRVKYKRFLSFEGNLWRTRHL